jgi:carbohydrate diacid regulator
MTKITVGVGSIADSIRELGKSYKEAQLSIVVGGIFESGKKVLNYNKLGIGRLVYQLPTKLCNLFLEEVFKDKGDYIFQAEVLSSINQFLENDFNVSEAAKHLYVHRNTLVYRLDKIQRDIGLDLRKFNDAVVLKFAIMVKKYMDSLENGGKK